MSVDEQAAVHTGAWERASRDGTVPEGAPPNGYAGANAGLLGPESQMPTNIDEFVRQTMIEDNTLNYGGGTPVQKPSGPGDSPFTPAIQTAAGIMANVETVAVTPKDTSPDFGAGNFNFGDIIRNPHGWRR